MPASSDAAIEALAREQFGAFSRQQAVAAGLSPDQVDRRTRNKRFVRVASGVFLLPGWDRTFEQRAMIAYLHAGAGSFLSHTCAARLRNLDGVTRSAVEITVPRRLRSIPDRPRVHYSTDCTVFDWAFLGPMPVASVTRTILDMAGAGASLDVLERMYECGQRRNETSYAALEEIVERLARRGKPGIPRMRELLARVPRDGKVNGSEAETRLFQICRDHGLPLPTRQRMVERADGSLAFADYSFGETPALLEVLGLAWHSASEQLRADAERRNALRPLGYTIYEVTWHHLTVDQQYVVRLVRRILRDTNREYRG